MTKVQSILKKYWGHHNFRPNQEEIINQVIAKNNVIALLPTGAGKSVCFQLPALIKKGVCIVISPLVALMEDQVNSLQQKGIKAIALTAKYTIDECITAFDNLQFGNYKFLYISPERLQSEFIQEKIGQLTVNLIAIDEAHCISQWGHDFRPAYLKISIIKEIHPKTNLIALSASATPKVMEDIKTILDIEPVKIFKQSFYRDNLNIKLIQTDDILERLKNILAKINEPLIIYTNTRKSCIDISNFLNHHQFKSTFYHGGLTSDEKSNALNDWMQQTSTIMVATSAFGMGIDKNNVRAIIHLNVPNSIESYMQEIGRAGRDNKKSFAILLYNKSTLFESEKILNQGIADKKFTKNVYIKLHDHFQLGIGEFLEKPFPFNLPDFCSKYGFPLLKTFSVLNNLENELIIEVRKNFNRKSRLKIIVNSNDLFDYEIRNPRIKGLLKVVLRNYGGTFEQFIQIDERFIAKKLNFSKLQVIDLLKKLNKDNIIIYNKLTSDSEIVFLKPRDDNFIINSISKNLEFRNKNKINKAKSVVDYIHNDKTCRNIQLLNYFGETSLSKCGTCDVCIYKQTANLKADYKVIAMDIMKLFKSENQLSSNDICNRLDYKKEYIIKTLQLMMGKNTIAVNLRNKFEAI